MTERYAVIGHPLAHTKSPLIHSSFAQETGQQLSYEAIESTPEAFKLKVKSFREAGGRGMNVTAPFKIEALAMASVSSRRAKLAGASNALKFNGAEIIAENFDGIGLVTDIQNNFGFAIRGRRILMLGAGGAARGAALPILEQNPTELVIVNRTVSKAIVLREQSSAYGSAVAAGYSDIPDGTFDIVLNATSASLRGELPPLNMKVFDRCSLAYDLVYGKGLTPFLAMARQAGVPKLADGVGMLVEQAAATFAWWRGIRPGTRTMIERISVPLS